VDRLDRRRIGIHLSVTPGLRSGPLRRWPVDVLHLHWLGTGFLSLFSLKRLHKPLVWTLHDLWPVQGLLPYPPLQSTPPSVRGLDLDPLATALKRRCMPAGVQFIAPSAWAARVAEQSAVYAALPQPRSIAVIPNAVDPLFFAPPAPDQAPRDAEHPLLLFGGSNTFSDLRKGWGLLQSLLPWLAQAYPQCRWASFGELPPSGLQFPQPWQHHGLIRDPHALAALYRSADLLVVPSQQETFGQVAAEAQACGLPVVALADSGVGSVLEHQQGGFLMREPTVEALREGLAFFLDQPQRLSSARAMAASSALRRFAPQLVAAQHLHLYRQLLAGAGL
jgi:glycosyltransferase involved in cell wall biosynthesis